MAVPDRPGCLLARDIALIVDGLRSDFTVFVRIRPPAAPAVDAVLSLAGSRRVIDAACGADFPRTQEIPIPKPLLLRLIGTLPPLPYPGLRIALPGAAVLDAILAGALIEVAVEGEALALEARFAASSNARRAATLMRTACAPAGAEE